jgi:hypothetical protein
MKGMKDDDVRNDNVRNKAEAETVRGQLPTTAPVAPAANPAAVPPPVAEASQHKPYPEFETPR